MTSLAVRLGACLSFVLSVVDCKSPPSPSETSAPTATSSIAMTTSTDECKKLQKAVVDEAAKLSTCKSNDDCKVHRLSVCDFRELDCYAAHVNKSGDTAALDKTVSAYAARCPVSKCKCEMPDKSVCKSGTCTGE